MRIAFNVAAIWNERLRDCIKLYETENRRNGKMSQSELARRFNEKYGDDLPRQIRQSDVSKWQNVKVGGKGGNPFPSIEMMLYIADFFDVDLGYLLGETDCKTFEMAEARDYTGLTKEALEKIRLATRFETAFSQLGMMDDEARQIISSLITSTGFFPMLVELKDIDRFYLRPYPAKALWANLERKYGDDRVRRALDFDPNDEAEVEASDDPKLPEAYCDVQEAIDTMREFDLTNQMMMEAQKYRVGKMFSDIIDELYPGDSAQTES